MAGDPAPLAAVQAAVLKTAAGKQGQAPPVQSTQANAVAQDLAVMADQAKGYTAGVDAGTIVAQDNRAAQASRLAQERAQADAARQRELAMEQAQTQAAMLRAEADRQSGQFAIAEKKARLAKQAAEETINPEWDADAVAVTRHAVMNRGPRFQDALMQVLGNATSPDEAVAILRNAQKYPNDYEWAVNIQEDVIRKYATEYFKAQGGGGVNFDRLKAARAATAARTRTNGSTAARPQGTAASDAVLRQYRAAGGGSGAGWYSP